MTDPMTPERLAEIRPWATQYLRQFPNVHAQQNTGNMMAMEWERLVDQAAEVDRLRAKLDAVEALTVVEWERADTKPLTDTLLVRLGRIRDALATGDEVQP